MILDKKQMTEEDIKLQYITPAIQSKWGLDRMTMETKITDGRVNLRGNFVFREKPKKADYVLYLAPNKPIAIVEAKDNNHSVSYGLQQAITYARMQDIPFAYSSNGDGFQEHDLLTGLERTLPLDGFPTVEELAARWEDGFDKAKKFTAAELAEELGYNLDQCGYPHVEEEILAPMDLIQRYQEERSSLNAEIDRVLAEITAKLGGAQ